MSGKILTLWVFTFLYGTSLGQTHLERKKGFQFNVQSFAMMVTDKGEDFQVGHRNAFWRFGKKWHLVASRYGLSVTDFQSIVCQL